MVSYNVELNIKQDGAIDTGIELTQGDFGEVQLLIRVKDDDSYIMDAVGAEVVFNLPNGYIVTGNATISAGTYAYVFNGNELQSAGKIVSVLTLTFSDGRVSSCSFVFNCRYNSLYDRRIPAGSYIAELEKIKEQAQAQVNYLNALIDALQGSFGGTALTRSDLSVAKDETIAGIHAADAVAIKEIYDKFQSYLPMTSLVNNELATVPGVAALDAAMGKALQDQITQQNNNLQTTNNNIQSVKDNMTHLSKMFRWQEVIVPIGELKENGGEVYNQTYIIPESYFENGKWTTAAITGFILSGTGYTNCSVTGCRVMGNKITYSVKNIGLTGLENIELKVFIMFVLL